MKKGKTHPDYQEVLFIDSSNNTKFVIGSALQTKEREMHEGKEYPVCRISVSSASHPFFTKSQQFIDTEGRVDKFTKRYKRKQTELKKEVETKKVAPVKKGKKSK